MTDASDRQYGLSDIEALTAADLPLQELADTLGLGTVIPPPDDGWPRRELDSLVVAFDAIGADGSFARYVMTIRDPFEPPSRFGATRAKEAKFARAAADAGVPIAAPIQRLRLDVCCIPSCCWASVCRQRLRHSRTGSIYMTQICP